MFGPSFKAVLCMTQTANQADLVAECPVYAQMASAKRSDRRNILDQAVRSLQIERKQTSLHLDVTPALVESLSSGRWARVNGTSVTSGFLLSLIHI